jgi:DNA-binding MarR family transcriptional regulator
VTARTSPDEAVDAVLRTVPRWARLLGQELEGLSPPLSLRQFLVLQRIGEGTSRNVDLARTIRVTSPTMTGVIDRLVDMGLVQRAIEPSDRRSFRLCLTTAGRRILNRHSRLLATRIRQVLMDDGEATEPDLEAVGRACEVLTRAMDARRRRVETTPPRTAKRSRAPA